MTMMNFTEAAEQRRRLREIPLTQRAYIDSGDARLVAKEWAREVKHWVGAQGGWIYRDLGIDSSATPGVRLLGDHAITQGWWNVWAQHRMEILDWLTRKLTAFESFNAMLNASSHYRPTIMVKTKREKMLADAYDLWQQQRGDARRTFRGTRAAR